MRVAIPHDLEREEVRRRMGNSTEDLRGFLPGGMADVHTSWPSEDRMQLTVGMMGQQVTGHVDIEDSQVVFIVDLPPALAFVEPIVEKAVRKGGQTMLEDKTKR